MGRSVSWMWALSLLGACSKGDSEDPDKAPGTTETGTPPSCDTFVLEALPADGDVDVYPLTSVRFTLSEADPTAVITVTSGDGATLSGSTEIDGEEVSWSGDPLQNETTYTSTIVHACGSESATWTTAPGEPPVEVDLVGDVFDLDPANGEWVEPAGIGDLIASQLGDTQIFLSVSALTDDEITMLVAIGSSDTQDLCNPTIALPPAAFTGAAFSIVSPELPLEISGVTLAIDEAEISGVFSVDGTRINEGTMAGSVDVRPLTSAIGLDDPDSVCELIAAFGSTCDACADGSGTYCIDLRIEQMVAPLLPGASVIERTEAEISADPSCN